MAAIIVKSVWVCVKTKPLGETMEGSKSELMLLECLPINDLWPAHMLSHL